MVSGLHRSVAPAALTAVALVAIALGLPRASGAAPATSVTPGDATVSGPGTPPVQRPPQIVVMAFDGAGPVDVWKSTRRFAKAHRVKFTYFLTGIFYFTRRQRRTYRPPGRGIGASMLGYAKSKTGILARIAQVNAAYREGHDIGSHAVGHFDGRRWSVAQWRHELQSWRRIVFGAAKVNRLGAQEARAAQLAVDPMAITGFRAPYLAAGRGLRRALKAEGYRYDTSGAVSKAHYWPRKRAGVWYFPLAFIGMRGSRRTVISMDYNFMVFQKIPRWVRGKRRQFRLRLYEQQMYESYLDYFAKSYNGNRAPLHIGHHFTQYHDGAHWRALRRFAAKVCGRSEVKCISYKGLVTYLESKDAATLDAYRRGAFPQVGSPFAYEPKIGTFRWGPRNRVGAIQAPTARRFCPGFYLGKVGGADRYVCRAAITDADLLAAMKQRRWTTTVAADGVIEGRAGRRRIRVRHLPCYLDAPCRSGYEIR